MSKENVELVLSVVEAIGRDDYEQAAKALHADAEWHNTSSFPGERTHSGRDSIKSFWKTLFDDFADGTMTVEEVASAGDIVVVRIHSLGRGRLSGAPVNVRWASVFRLRDGGIARVDVFGDYARALEAAGLAERDDD